MPEGHAKPLLHKMAIPYIGMPPQTPMWQHAAGSGTRFGWEGWRVAFLLLGIISLSIGLANFACASEPRSFDSKLPFGLPARKAADSSTWAKFKATLWDIQSVVTVPTFAIIIVQVTALRCEQCTEPAI